MNIIFKHTNELIPYENNPRINDDAVEYVANSIKEFGFKNPILIDADNCIIAGHTRLKAAMELGIEEVPTIMCDDLTEEQVKAFRLADNKVAEFSAWDFSLLEEELADIEIDMNGFGFDMEGISVELDDDLFADHEPKETEPKQIKCPHCGEYFEV